MRHELQAMERQAMAERINELESMLKAMQCDFAKSARGISPCFFCAKDDSCQCVDDKKCEFVWEKHN